MRFDCPVCGNDYDDCACCQGCGSERCEDYYNISRPLFVAIANDQIRVVKLLLDRGADTGYGENCHNAVEYAQMHGNTDMVKLLENY